MLKHQLNLIGLDEEHVKYLHALVSASVAGMNGDLMSAIEASMASEGFLVRMDSEQRLRLANILNTAFTACNCGNPNCNVHNKAGKPLDA